MKRNGVRLSILIAVILEAVFDPDSVRAGGRPQSADL